MCIGLNVIGNKFWCIKCCWVGVFDGGDISGFDFEFMLNI